MTMKWTAEVLKRLVEYYSIKHDETSIIYNSHITKDCNMAAVRCFEMVSKTAAVVFCGEEYLNSYVNAFRQNKLDITG
jgi:hypothetical protein